MPYIFLPLAYFFQILTGYKVLSFFMKQIKDLYYIGNKETIFLLSMVVNHIFSQALKR